MNLILLRIEFIFSFFVFLQVKEFLSRFDNIPDILELDHLTVAGDVRFGRNVTLKVKKQIKGSITNP